MVKRCSPREKNEKGGREVDKKGASRGEEKRRWRRKLRGGSNHRRILWDHNSGCRWYHRPVEVLEDSFLPSPPPVLIRNPSGDPPSPPPRSFTADSTRLAAIEIVSRPDIVVFLATCRYETSTRLLIKRSFEGGIVGEGLRSRIVLLVSTVR